MVRASALDAICVQQCGVFARHQALACGLTDDAICAQLDARRWQRIHPGVFAAFTGPLPDTCREWAALLWAGSGAALCDMTALAQYGFSSSDPDRRIHVAVDHGRRVIEPTGIALQRRRRLDEFVHPARVPRVLRLEDAALHTASRLPRLADGLALLADVHRQRLTTPFRLRSALAHLPKLKSRKAFWEVLDDIHSGAHSLLELSYLRSVEHAHGLPKPRRQRASFSLGQRVWRDGEYDDWGVLLELDGRLGHDSASDRFRDRRRDQVAAGQGKVTLRNGYPEVMDQPCETAALVVAVLRERGWRGEPTHCGDRCRLSVTMDAVTMVHRGPRDVAGRSSRREPSGLGKSGWHHAPEKLPKHDAAPMPSRVWGGPPGAERRRSSPNLGAKPGDLGGFSSDR